MKYGEMKYIPAAAGAILCGCLSGFAQQKGPNVVYVLADQWRGQDTGYAGNPDVVTPNIDALARESVNVPFTVATMPVSTPYRGTFLTGMYAQSHGLFINDVTLDPEITSIGKVYRGAGYNTGYIGKWHVNGNGRSNYIPESHRQGFEYFKVLECTHDYMNSAYYDNDDRRKKKWEGYDAIDQTRDAARYIGEHARDGEPFMLVLSWGPPHNPYRAVPQEYLDIYADRDITLRPNVPEDMREKAEYDLKGYYAHIAALDGCIGTLQKAISDAGIEDNTIFVFTSDHGDMLGSQGEQRKQKPWDESILVPFLVKWPAALGCEGSVNPMVMGSVDIMPTLLGLSGIAVPETVEGDDLSGVLLGTSKDRTEAAVIECITPFGEWERRSGGREYRGIRTRRYTYVRDLDGPWLLYDNAADPYQMENLIGRKEYSRLQKKLDRMLSKMLRDKGDEFLPGEAYIEKWGYKVNANGTMEYTP